MTSVDYKVDLRINKMPKSIYDQLSSSGGILSDQIYLVEEEYADLGGQQIKNLAEPALSSDAATKNYVDTEIAKIPAPDMSEYYKRSETSSAVEISSAFENVIVSPLSGLVYDLAEEGAFAKLVVDVGRALGATVLHEPIPGYIPSNMLDGEATQFPTT